jgi:tripartite-type tricarboxylate transporter receptor subunit TctC
MRFLAWYAACLICAHVGIAVGAQNDDASSFPDRPVRILVGFAAGGGADVVTRVVAENLSQRWKQPVVVENRPGASGVIAAGLLARAANDGYTLGSMSASDVIVSTITPKLPYDFTKDFSSVSQVTRVPFVLNVGTSPTVASVKSVGDLIAVAHKQPRPLTFGSGGSGTVTHLTGEMFASAVNIKALHVPYKGGAPAAADLMGGQIDFMFSNAPEVIGFIRGGRLRPLGVTSPRRLVVLPEVPTVAETVIGFEAAQWFGIFGPAAIPRPILEKINAAFNETLMSREVRKKYDDMGVVTAPGSQADFDKFVRSEVVRWAKVTRTMDLTGPR